MFRRKTNEEDIPIHSHTKISNFNLKKRMSLMVFYTKLLEINRRDFRIEKHGVRHASGTFFKLDRSNFKAAKRFLNEVWYE